MAIEALYAGTRNTVCDWDFAFTGDAIVDAAALSATKGGTLVAAKTLAAAGAVLHVGLCDGLTENPLGALINPPGGNAFENLPNIASEKAPYWCGLGTYKVDAENIAVDGHTGQSAGEGGTLDSIADWVGKEGKFLYCGKNDTGNSGVDNRGKFNFQRPVSTALPVGVILKVPTATDLTLIFDLRL